MGVHHAGDEENHAQDQAGKTRNSGGKLAAGGAARRVVFVCLLPKTGISRPGDKLSSLFQSLTYLGRRALISAGLT